MENNRTFINGCWIEEKVFDENSSILKLSILPDKFIQHLQSLQKTDKGYVKLVISRRKNPSENGSHSIYWDSYGATVKTEDKSAPVAKTPLPKAKSTNNKPVEVDDDTKF